MSVIYNTQYVDEKYSKIIEPNLYYDSVLIPGVTYTDKYEEQAGGIFIHKLGGGSFVAPTTPASDFSDVVVADTLIQAVFNNNFKKSRKIYGVTAAAVAYNKAEGELQEALAETKEGWQLSGMACLMVESTDMADTTALSSSNIETKYLAMRQTLKLAKAKPNFALMRSGAYTLTLQVAGDNYRPSSNERIIGQGITGTWFGIEVIEANSLAETSVTYYDYTGTLNTVDLSAIDIIMGDYRAFSVLNNFEAFRIIDSERFAGSLAQVEFNTAYRVTTKARILTKYSSTPSA
ncbi:MAG: hypothetical protein KAX49_07250 [Halanaerobiales bacterium]|nr:hypothetical protein [Halanaerobiales bacterium]